MKIELTEREAAMLRSKCQRDWFFWLERAQELRELADVPGMKNIVPQIKDNLALTSQLLAKLRQPVEDAGEGAEHVKC